MLPHPTVLPSFSIWLRVLLSTRVDTTEIRMDDFLRGLTLECIRIRNQKVKWLFLDVESLAVPCGDFISNLCAFDMLGFHVLPNPRQPFLGGSIMTQAESLTFDSISLGDTTNHPAIVAGFFNIDIDIVMPSGAGYRR